MDSDSETASLLTLTDSLCRDLYRYRGETRFQSTNHDYSWPCDSTASKLERLIAEVLDRTYLNGLYPETEPGYVSRLLSSPQSRVLDLGSGSTVTWGISMAEMYPDVEVIGVDLVPCEVDFLPPNLETEIYDLLKGLPYPDDFFNLIHCRFFESSFLENPKLDFFAEIARVLRPGGVLLCQCLDDRNTPFYSDIPNNPYLAPMLARHSLRTDALAALSTKPDGTPPIRLDLNWGTRMSTRIGTTVTESGGTFDPDQTQVVRINLPLGRTSPNGGLPGTRQLGTVVRDAWMIVLEMMTAAAGMDEETIRRERERDEASFPVQDVGLFMRFAVVWAVKSAS